MPSVEAQPYAFDLDPARVALLIIDMQRDFLEPGSFGAMLGNDIAQLRRTVEPNRRLLAAWREAGLFVNHTREGHRPDLADLPHAKKVRGRGAKMIGDPGPMGRILVRGEPGHDIIPELYPATGEPVIDKPGKGAFFATDLHAILENRGIARLVVTEGVYEINIPEVVAAVIAAFQRYEQALVGNDVAALNELFQRSPQTVRLGITENLYGYDAIAAFRSARSPLNLARHLRHAVITTYGRDFATANTEFERATTPRIGRQSHAWLRLPDGWRIVAAHVSYMDPLT